MRRNNMKRLFGMLLVVGIVGLMMSCGGTTGTITIAAGSDQNDNLSKSFDTLATVAGASNEVKFSPADFYVTIKKVRVIKTVDDDWQELWSGSQRIEIVASDNIKDAINAVPAGEYHGVAITYQIDWTSSVLVSSNDLPTVGIPPNTNFVYKHTNSTVTTESVVYFATAQMTDIPAGYDPTTLSAPVTFESGVAHTVQLIFKTENMITAWTNTGDGSLEPGSPVFNAPGLDMQVK